MARYQNLTGIVYRKFAAKDADLVIYLLNHQGEKVPVIAKSVRKSTSKKAHALDLLNLVQVKLVQGKGKLPIVTEAKLVSEYQEYKQDYAGLMFVQLVCEVIGFFAEQGQEEPGIFNNINNLLQIANSSRYSLLAATIILRLIYSSGNLPKLNEDIYTGTAISRGAIRVSANPIGYTVDNQSHQDGVSDRLYKVQRFIINNDYRMVQSIQLSPEEDLSLFRLHLNWLQNTVEKELKTASLFLQALKSS